MGAPGTETPTQKRPRTYSRHGLNTLRRALTTSVPGGEAGGKSHPLTRGGSVPALGARRDRSGERPYRGKKGTVLVGLGGYQMVDSLAIDRDGHICVATFISGVAATSGPTTKTSPFN